MWSVFIFDQYILLPYIKKYTEPEKKLPFCLSADIHKYENHD